MISLKELLNGVDYNTLPRDHQNNIITLLERINKVREKWNKPMIVTSGYRSKADHIRIYKELAKKRNITFKEASIPWGSAHLVGAAVDISDPTGELYEWVFNNQALMEEIGLWMEVKDDQKRVHFQVYSPKSGKRFFNP